MGLLSASGSFTRFNIVEDVSDDVIRRAPELLRKNAFKDIDHTADERSFGWVCFEDMLDNEWRTAPPEKGAYLAFALRLDTRRIPPAVMKKHVRIALDAEKEALKDTGKSFISKDRKKEIAEQVTLKLRARTLPIPAVFDVVWNLTTHQILLNSTNNKLLEMFEDLFTLTFELHLEPTTPYFLALRLADESRHALLDELEPSPFSAGTGA